jgi:hypothetical protein
MHPPLNSTLGVDVVLDKNLFSCVDQSNTTFDGCSVIMISFSALKNETNVAGVHIEVGTSEISGKEGR